ncbi:hypothetical protein LCGC14_1360030 [marine sediment metagenome]|uniref:Uncharacterized protein n=1 Tax=marine sediment metagenome TaxID=412755 RepID=A0A0F9MNS6_9ZZZZ
MNEFDEYLLEICKILNSLKENDSAKVVIQGNPIKFLKFIVSRNGKIDVMIKIGKFDIDTIDGSEMKLWKD